MCVEAITKMQTALIFRTTQQAINICVRYSVCAAYWRMGSPRPSPLPVRTPSVFIYSGPVRARTHDAIY